MEAYLYDRKDGDRVACNLCSHRCLIRPEKRGICAVRENRNGVLHTLVYGMLIAANADPVEKKPLFHFMPGSLSFSIATVGCNFRCRFCQNADIAQMPQDAAGRISGRETSPGKVVDNALAQGCASVSYTYTEPTIFFEFAYDTARLARQKGLRNIFVTNGYMTAEALDMIAPYLDAANVDLKSFSNRFYRDTCGARLDPVKDTLRRMKSKGIFVEVTTLLIPGVNDAPDELKSLATFISRELGPDTPWHISRFHPTYRLTDRSATPPETLIRAREIGIGSGLKYVYTGNLPGDRGEKTYCYGCGKILVDRTGFRINGYFIENGRCPDCGEPVDGVGM